jgi:hypothetical protein
MTLTNLEHLSIHIGWGNGKVNRAPNNGEEDGSEVHVEDHDIVMGLM